MIDETPDKASAFKRANLRTVELIGEIGDASKLHTLDFFFYADTFDNAADLVSELKSYGYAVGIDKSEGRSGEWSIIGFADKMKIDDNTILNWIEEMEQLAKKYTCKFDGWGTIASD